MAESSSLDDLRRLLSDAIPFCVIAEHPIRVPAVHKGREVIGVSVKLPRI
jgi:hypothetical protein